MGGKWLGLLKEVAPTCVGQQALVLRWFSMIDLAALGSLFVSGSSSRNSDCGDETDNWPGHRIELYPDKTQMGGKPVDCIRVRAPAQRELLPAQRKAPARKAAPMQKAPAPPPTDDSTNPAAEMNDDIPWRGGVHPC